MSSSTTPSRSELLNNAILFLRDSKVRSSSLQSKIEFLHGKGLTDEEVQEALGRAAIDGDGASSSAEAGPGPGTLGYGRGQGAGGWGNVMMDRAPEVPRRDWRDWFVSLACSSCNLAWDCVWAGVHMA